MFLQSLLSKLGATIAGIGLLFGGGALAHAPIPQTSTPTFGASTFSPVGGQTYTLAGSGVTATQNTILLTSFQTADGRALTMANFGSVGYGVIEPNTTSKIEDVTFTGVTQNANGTALLTGVTRGIDFVSPYAPQTFLQKAHAGGSYFILSNPASFYGQQFALTSNPTTISAVWTFASTSRPRLDQNATSTNAADLVTVGQLNNTAFNGAGVVQASFNQLGVSQLATGLQIASSTVNGSAGVLVIPASLATSTYNALTAPLKVVVTQNNGKIDTNFIGNLASSTSIGSTYSFDIGKNIRVFTASSTFAVPNGIHKVFVRVFGAGGLGSASQSGSGCFPGGSSGGYAEGVVDVSATTTVNVIIGDSLNVATTTTSFGGNILYATGGSSGNSCSSNGTACTSPSTPGGFGSGTSASVTVTGNIGPSCYVPSGASTSQVGASGVLGSIGAGGPGDTVTHNLPGSNGEAIIQW